jgi:hypothetical protein
MYFKIAKDRLASARVFERSTKELKLDPSPWIKLDLIDMNVSKYFEAVVESIVFSGLTIEAFINSYALTHVSRSRFKILNNLSLRQKWIEIPKAVTGREIPGDSQAMTQLAGLIKARNNLVHYKTGDNDASKYYSHVGTMLRETEAAHAFPLTIQAESSIGTIELLIDELNKIDSRASRADLMFNENENRWYELWSPS